MYPAHRLTVTASIENQWFKSIGKRTPWGYIVEMDTQKIGAAFSASGISAQNLSNINDSVFVVSTRGRKPNKVHYYGIIDRQFCPQVQKKRWVVKNRSKYICADGSTYPLHKEIFRCAGNTGGLQKLYVIHHKNFFTFDNRLKNLQYMTKSMHSGIHNSTNKAKDQAEINNEIDLIDFITTLF